MGEPAKVKVSTICAVNLNPDEIKLLEDGALCTVIRSDTGLDYADAPNVLFVFADFNGDVFLKFTSSCPEAPVFGLPFIKSRVLRNLPLPRPKPKRSVYCDMLRNINIVIGHGSETEKNLWGKLIRYMGGHVKKEPDNDTTFLVTKEARGRAFRMMVSLGQKVLLPSWLEECWENRGNLGFDPSNNTLLLKHRIGVFESLKVLVVGFDRDYSEDIKNNITKFRGTIVDDSKNATHVVVSRADDTLHLETLSLSKNQRIVTAEWVWTSISIQYCANEDTYTPALQTARTGTNTSSRSSVLSPSRSAVRRSQGSTNTVLSVSSNEELLKEGPAVVTRAHHVCIEIFETDVSYSNSLKLLMKVKEDLERAIDSGDPLMQKADVVLIFGKIQPIVAAHEKIITSLKRLLDNWDEACAAASISQVWIDAFDELDRVYAPYSNNYDMALKALIAADGTDPRIHAFIRAKECSTEFKRNQFQDLLIRPVQRLPTVVVLLKELQKRDITKSEKVDEAIALVEKIISRVNAVRAQNDEFIEQISFFNEVEDVPPHLVCSRRKLVRSVDAYSIGGTMEWSNLIRRRVRIVLYNDVILVCKVRSSTERTGTLKKLTRHASFSNLMETKKPYKYFSHLLIPSIREINRLKFSQYEGSVDDRLEPTDALPIFGWTIRDVSSDASWYIEAVDKDRMSTFVEEVHKKIFMDLGRDTSWNGFTLADVHSYSLRELLKKHVKKALSKERDYLETTQAITAELPTFQSFGFASIGRSAKGLRRTVSHVGNSFVRLAIPHALRSHRSTATAASAEESPVSRATVPSSDLRSVSISQCQSVRPRSKTGSSSIEYKDDAMVTVLEELEKELDSTSDKEN